MMNLEVSEALGMDGDEVFMGFEPLPLGCPDSITTPRSMPDGARPDSMGTDPFQDVFNPNNYEVEISACMKTIGKEIVHPMLGRCLGGGDFTYPMDEEDDALKESDLALQVMYPNARKKRQAEDMKAMQDGMEAWKTMMSLAKLKEALGTLDYLHTCNEETNPEAGGRARLAVFKCLRGRMEEEGLMENRTRNALGAAKCIKQVPDECHQQMRYRAKHICRCGKIFRNNFVIETAFKACVPETIHEFVVDAMIGNFTRDMEHGLCDDKKFDLDEFCEEQRESKKRLMKAIMTGDVDPMELMYRMKEMHMEEKDGPMGDMMGMMMTMMEKNMGGMGGLPPMGDPYMDMGSGMGSGMGGPGFAPPMRKAKAKGCRARPLPPDYYGDGDYYTQYPVDEDEGMCGEEEWDSGEEGCGCGEEWEWEYEEEECEDDGPSHPLPIPLFVRGSRLPPVKPPPLPTPGSGVRHPIENPEDVPPVLLQKGQNAGLIHQLKAKMRAKGRK